MTDKEAMQMALHAMHSAREFLAVVEDPRSRLQETRLHDAMREVRAAMTQEDEADTTYEVWQDDEWQAGSNSKEETMRYAMQYAEQEKKN